MPDQSHWRFKLKSGDKREKKNYPREVLLYLKSWSVVSRWRDVNVHVHVYTIDNISPDNVYVKSAHQPPTYWCMIKGNGSIHCNLLPFRANNWVSSINSRSKIFNLMKIAKCDPFVPTAQFSLVLLTLAFLVGIGGVVCCCVIDHPSLILFLG